MVCLAQDPAVLLPGVPYLGELHTLTKPRIDFEFEIPPGCVFAKLRLVANGGDVDLYAGLGEAPVDLSYAALASTELGGVEELLIDRLSEPPIESGTWWCSLITPDEVLQGRGLKPRRSFSLEAKFLMSRTDAVLAAGAPATFALEPELGGFCSFRIDVPENAGALRIDLHGAPANLDLFLCRQAPMQSLLSTFAMARHDWGAETLLLDKQSRPSLLSGAWYVEVMDVYSSGLRTPFEIRVAFDASPPLEWSTPPRLVVADPQRPLARALSATLEVFRSDGGGGSATLLTPDGLLLTNAHVVDRGDMEPLDELVLAANLDSRRPAVEAFRGSVLRFDAELDLALIQIDRGFYGTPLAADYRFPWVELGDDALAQIGDPMWIVGYPSLGGSGSRVSIHCARGVIAGFDRAGAGLSFKTDAVLLEGNSGGAALDERGRLIGVPSAVLSDEYASIGLVTPLCALPEEWRALIAARLAR
jgi:S1-C subfamily serine protease